MEYAADEINYGYRAIMMLINSENTLVDKIENIKEIDGTKKHPLFGTNQGGVTFSMMLKGMQTLVEIVLNKGDRFDIKIMNFLHIFYTNLKDDENKLLREALDPHNYRKAAKKMHYREMFGDDPAI
jgi:hypothetical protein